MQATMKVWQAASAQAWQTQQYVEEWRWQWKKTTQRTGRVQKTQARTQARVRRLGVQGPLNLAHLGRAGPPRQQHNVTHRHYMWVLQWDLTQTRCCEL